MSDTTPTPEDLARDLEADLAWVTDPDVSVTPRMAPVVQGALRLAIHYRAAIRRHRDYRSDDRCFLDDYELYRALGEPIPKHACQLDDPQTMALNCIRFIGSRHDPSKPYTSPMRRIEELEAENAQLRQALALAEASRTDMKAQMDALEDAGIAAYSVKPKLVRPTAEPGPVVCKCSRCGTSLRIGEGSLKADKAGQWSGTCLVCPKPEEE